MSNSFVLFILILFFFKLLTFYLLRLKTTICVKIEWKLLSIIVITDLMSVLRRCKSGLLNVNMNFKSFWPIWLFHLTSNSKCISKWTYVHISVFVIHFFWFQWENFEIYLWCQRSMFSDVLQAEHPSNCLNVCVFYRDGEKQREWCVCVGVGCIVFSRPGP